jgi:hypothetical protein
MSNLTKIDTECPFHKEELFSDLGTVNIKSMLLNLMLIAQLK